MEQNLMATPIYELIRKDGKPDQIIAVRPTLGQEIGRDEAEVLVQILYWIKTQGKEMDGQKRMRMSYETMMANGIYWAKKDRLSRIIKHLCELELIQVTNTYRGMFNICATSRQMINRR
jgi:site-specific recombinase